MRQCVDKVIHGATALTGALSNYGNVRENILDPVVKLGDQQALLLLGPLALGYVDIDADYAFRTLVAIVDDEGAGLDPTNLIARPYNPILHVVLALPFSNGLVQDRIVLGEIVGLHARSPIVAPYCAGPFREAVHGGAPWRNLYPRGGNVECVVAHEGCLFNECEVCIAFGDGRLLPPPFREECREGQSTESNCEYSRLTGQDTSGEGNAWIAQTADAKCDGPHHRRGENEYGCRCEHRPAASCQPEEQRQG